MSNPRNLARRWFEEIWNQQREETIDELCADDFRAIVTGLDRPAGKEDFRRHYRGMTSALSDLHVEVLDVSGEGDTAVVRFRLTGLHTGPGLGVPPTGRPLAFDGLTWMIWKNGRLVGGEDRWNRGEVMTRLTRKTPADLQKSHDLTRRQAEVALLMAERRNYKEIARELGIRPNTVRRHSTMVLRKLGVNRREDVARIVDNGTRTRPPFPPHGSDLEEERTRSP